MMRFNALRTLVMTTVLLSAGGHTPIAQQRTVRGLAHDMVIYEIP